MTDELLPCPFCGGESRHYSRMNGDDFLQWKESHWVCCVEDDCGNQTCMHGSKESAFAAWNRRPKAAQKLVEGEKWQAEDIRPESSQWVRILSTYKDNSYRNHDGEYIFFETEGFYCDGAWRISPPSHVCDSYQEAEEKLKVMFWMHKTPHPKATPPTPSEASHD